MSLTRNGAGVGIGLCDSPGNQRQRVYEASAFCAKITANDPVYTFAEVTYSDATWTVKTGGKTGTAINIAEVADTDIEKIPVDSIVEVQTITYSGTKYYIISRDISSGTGAEESPALADLIELASTQGTRDEDYWRADINVTDLAYNIDNTALAAKLTQLLNVGGFVGATVTLTDGPAPADVTIEFVGAWDTVPLLEATSHLTGTDPTVTVTQVDTTHQTIDFGGTVTGGTFDLLMPGYTGDQPVLVRVITDLQYDKSTLQLTYRTRNIIFFGQEATFVGPESDPLTLITTAVVHA
ncbi:hypothetical protein LLG46_02415 [bacterium]|nr:hypothetical protein [bacterium]